MNAGRQRSVGSDQVRLPDLFKHYVSAVARVKAVREFKNAKKKIQGRERACFSVQ
jgi:hypothetical protein